MLEALLKYPFLQHAVLAALLSAVLTGIIGVVLVEKRMVMMSGGVAHTAYGGVGLGYLLGFSPLLGGFLFSLAASFGIGFIRRRSGGNTDVPVALFWSVGMAAGIFFLAMTPGYPPDLNAYLFGDVLTVTRSDLLLMGGVTLAVLLAFLIFYQDWKSYLFDSGFAAITGLKTKLLEYLLLALIAGSVVALIRLSGIMLAIALLTVPAATASLLSRSLSGRMLIAAGFSALYSLVGLILSYYLGIPSGATIIMVSAVIYLSLFGFRKLLEKRA